jgi:hypothetical protein
MNATASRLTRLLLTALATVTLLGAEQPFSVTLEAPNKPLEMGGELRLRVTVKNVSNHDMTFVRSVTGGVAVNEEERYKIYVVNPKGQPAPPSAWILAMQNSKPGQSFVYEISGENHSRTLEPGQSFVDEINVTSRYDLIQPGTYTVWVTRGMPPKVTPQGVEWPKGLVKSNTITVTVVK